MERTRDSELSAAIEVLHVTALARYTRAWRPAVPMCRVCLVMHTIEQNGDILVAKLLYSSRRIAMYWVETLSLCSL
ncbi:hypothetical protein KIN20_032201 [Parelaphostrongylus tenuis]|uniref:Uncharacterized protein n=1 Tax=Parelaphostrongylus tenuis TaxID=148309 RepID=A0AAD5R6L1_PARTN|nr:hypothetical protein KIN20_032201 [Parelaphostrongylus tenuis]